MRGPGREGRRRAVAGAAVGGGLWLAAYLVLRVPDWSSVFAHAQCQSQQPWGCLGLAIAGAFALQLALVLLPWPLLSLARVRPAWQPAGVGLLAAFVGYAMYGSLNMESPLHGGPWSALLSALLYGAAALATYDGWLKRGRGLALACIIVLFPLIAGIATGYGLPVR
jgi:hypothetical protein